MGHVDRLAPVTGLTDHLEIVLGLDHHAQTGAHQLVVVGDQDTNGHFGTGGRSTVVDRCRRRPGAAECCWSRGSSARTRKPRSSPTSATSRPPRTLARSRIPAMPRPLSFLSWPAPPAPSSVTRISSSLAEHDRVTSMRAGPACLIALVN